MQTQKEQTKDRRPIKAFKHSRFNSVIKQVAVVMPIGGESKRMGDMPGGLHKALLPLPNGQTMLSYTMKQYAAIGVRRFILLSTSNTEDGVRAYTSERYLKNIQIIHSVTETGEGKGYAVARAIKRKLIPQRAPFIIHNPDDIILEPKARAILTTAFSRHLNNEEEGAVATLVSVDGTPYPYSSFKAENNRITNIERHAMVPLITHAGITIFSPRAQKRFIEHYPAGSPLEFEATLFPVFCSEGSLYLTMIPQEPWIAVNDRKDWERLCSIIQRHAKRT